MRRDNPDSNAKEFYPNLAREGWLIARIASAVQRRPGIPDAIICRARGRQQNATGLNHLLELKSLGGRLSPEQIEFARTWTGCVHVATNSWEANELLKMCEVMLRQKP